VGDLSDYYSWLVVILSTFSIPATHYILLGDSKILIRQLFLRQIQAQSLQNVHTRSAVYKRTYVDLVCWQWCQFVMNYTFPDRPGGPPPPKEERTCSPLNPLLANQQTSTSSIPMLYMIGREEYTQPSHSLYFTILSFSIIQFASYHSKHYISCFLAGDSSV
jgi:hypothetical protein